MVPRPRETNRPLTNVTRGASSDVGTAQVAQRTEQQLCADEGGGLLGSDHGAASLSERAGCSSGVLENELFTSHGEAERAKGHVP